MPFNSSKRISQSWVRNGLVGAWCPALTGATGTDLFDLSGFNNTGVLTNMDAATDWVESPYGAALGFDGSTNYVIGVRPIPAMTQVSLLAWANLANQSVLPEGRVVANIPISDTLATSPFTELTISVDTSRNVVAQVGDGSARTVFSTTMAAPADEWFFMGLTWQNGNLLAYLNRSSQSLSTTNYANITTGTRNFYIGSYNQSDGTGGIGNYRWPGQIGYVAAWKRALTDWEVQALYAGGPGYGLIGYGDIAR